MLKKHTSSSSSFFPSSYLQKILWFYWLTKIQHSYNISVAYCNGYQHWKQDKQTEFKFWDSFLFCTDVFRKGMNLLLPVFYTSTKWRCMILQWLSALKTELANQVQFENLIFILYWSFWERHESTSLCILYMH